jgi:L-ascorbate metabolism protein UlaG (beta-lactamase superfamily)
MSIVRFTWLGHSTLLFEANGRSLLVDPWLASNPACPALFHDLCPDVTLITHAHGDHMGDVFSLRERGTGPVVAMYDLTEYLGARGFDAGRLIGMNKGGRLSLPDAGVRVVMTDARHSSSLIEDGQFITLGEAAGYVLEFDGGPTVYVAGDTCVFGDMALIRRLYAPSIAVLPIGDHFTMDPEQAAVACELLGVDRVIPVHWGTFGLLTGTPDGLVASLCELGLTTRVLTCPIGESIDLD